MATAPIIWKLTEAFPSTAGNLFNVINEWKEHKVISELERKSRLHELMGMVIKDEKYDSTWRTYLGVNLMKVISLVKRKAYDLSQPLDPMSKEYNRLWLLKNCRPSGGNWKPNVKLNPANPTGKPCCSRLCPWCHLRKVNDMIAMITALRGSKVQLFNGKFSKGLGLGETVNMTSYVVCGPMKTEGIDFINSETLDRLLELSDKAVRERSKGVPEFEIALKVLMPIYVHTKDGSVGGWRISYIHNTNHVDALPESMPLRPGSSAQVHRFQQLKLADALLIAARFPIDILSENTGVQTISRFMSIMEGKRAYTTKEFSPAQARVAIEPRYSVAGPLSQVDGQDASQS